MKLIPLTRDKFAMIDDEDYPLVSCYKWQYAKREKNEYATANFWQHGKNHPLLMHRLVMNAKPDEEVDHKSGNGLDNQKDNLRVVTHVQNMQNARVKEGKYKGISLNKHRNVYEAYVNLPGKRVSLGSYPSAASAACAYDFAAIKFFGEYARLNFPNGQPLTMDEVEKQRGRQDKTSKYQGVYFCVVGLKWKAQITSDYKCKHLGTFDSEVEAAKAYNDAAILMHGDKAKLNKFDKA